VLIPLNKAVSFGKRCVKNKIVLQKLNLRSGDALSVRRVGSVVAGQAECPCHGPDKAWAAVSITDSTGITEYNSGFVGIFYRNIFTM